MGIVNFWLIAKTIMLLFLALMIGLGAESMWMVHKWGKGGEKGRG